METNAIYATGAECIENGLQLKDLEGFRSFLDGEGFMSEGMTNRQLLSEWLGINVIELYEDGSVDFVTDTVFDDFEFDGSVWKKAAPFLAGYCVWTGFCGEYCIWRDTFKDGQMTTDMASIVWPKQKDDALACAFKMGAAYGSLCENGRVKGDWLKDEAGVFKKACRWAEEYYTDYYAGPFEDNGPGDFIERRLDSAGILLPEDYPWYEEKWYRSDLERVLEDAGIEPTRENLDYFEARCRNTDGDGIFDSLDLSGRNGILEDFAREVFRLK